MAKIKVPKLLAGIHLTFSVLIFAIAILIATFPDQIIKAKRDWDMQVMVTGFKLTWKYQDKPDFAKYDPRKK